MQKKKTKKNNETVFFPLYLLERNHDSIKSKSNEKKFRDVALILLLLTIETVFNNFQNEIYKYTFYKLKFDLQSLWVGSYFVGLALVILRLYFIGFFNISGVPITAINFISNARPNIEMKVCITVIFISVR